MWAKGYENMTQANLHLNAWHVKGPSYHENMIQLFFGS